MKRLMDNIGLLVALLINKVKAVFAKNTCNSLIMSILPPPTTTPFYVKKRRFCVCLFLFQILFQGEATGKLRTERLLTERTVALFLFQYTDVWFLCKTNLEHYGSCKCPAPMYCSNAPRFDFFKTRQLLNNNNYTGGFSHLRFFFG